MQSAYVVTGTLDEGQRIELDEILPLTKAKVRVTVEPMAGKTVRPLDEVLASIRQQQQACGFQPPTAEAVNAYIRAEREGWGE